MSRIVAQYTILLVEDNDIARSAMRLLFEDRGHQVIDVSNGRDALSRCLELAECGVDVDVAVLDLGLPDTHGTQLIDQLRAAVTIAHVIYCSGRSRTEPEVQQLLATDSRCAYFEKPVRFDEVLKCIHAHRAGS